MKTMKALHFEKYGPPTVLSIQDLQVPDLKPGEVLVELQASAINPSDVKNVAGAFRALLPGAGRDLAFGVTARMRNISPSVRTGSPRNLRVFRWRRRPPSVFPISRRGRV
jgi:NADPH:quinone reductase-like Zn-dependent oxidoreductase